MQRNWIGRSTGADVDFAIEGRDEPVTVYTTRPDTLFGATFFVVAADSDLAAELAAEAPAEVQAEFDDVPGAGPSGPPRSSGWRPTRPKTGVFLQRYAINPVNGERLPICAADYVLADYGHGAIMAVPAHDQRDLDFARTFDLPVRVVVDDRDAEDPAVDRRSRTHRRRRAGQLRPAGRPAQGRRDRARSSTILEDRGRARPPSTTGCATG